MSKDEFKKIVDSQFYSWTSQDERPLASWLFSLEAWVSAESNREYERKKQHEKKETK